MALFDKHLSRPLTDEDLPLGLTVAQVEAVLKENGYSFYSLGCPDGVGGSGWDDRSVMRCGTLRYGLPERGETIKFDTIRELLLTKSHLPNINDPEIQDLLDFAARSAANVLRQKFPDDERGVGVKFEAAIRFAMEQMVRGHEPDMADHIMPRMVIDRPLDLDPVKSAGPRL